MKSHPRAEYAVEANDGPDALVEAVNNALANRA